MLHRPVMLKEVLGFLSPRPGQIFLDCTVGTAGHAQEIIKRILPGGKLVGIDRDAEALKTAQEELKDFADNYELVHDDFRNLDAVLDGLKIEQVDGILFDLGISSLQLDSPERGFSIKFNGPLDMRMDQEAYISAYDLVNSLSEDELADILRNFGQERYYNRIARLLVKERASHPIATTRQLSDIVLKAIPYRFQSRKIHPATRTFQALRIAVNRELEALDIALKKAVNRLNKLGRIGVISFHSLEDKLVKEDFRNFHKQGILKIVTPKPVETSFEESQDNPRSRSARLRAAERI
ncbi:MAG: 16S rRNA (cytosine(1402)-N(4))-methyltransferase RsmH [Candidatus Omnitrophota bacterium]